MPGLAMRKNVNDSPWWYLAGLLLVSAHEPCSAADERVTLKLAIHVHSTTSTGTLDPSQILPLATQAGLDAVLFTDSALRRWEYGLWPARAWIKRVIEQPSVRTFGAARYLDTLRPLSRPQLLVLAGLEFDLSQIQ